MAASAGKVTATTTAATLIDTSSQPLSDRAEGRYMIENIGSVNVYLGGSNVTSAGANGKRLQPGQVLGFELTQGDKLYVVASSGTCDVDWLRLEP